MLRISILTASSSISHDFFLKEFQSLSDFCDTVTSNDSGYTTLEFRVVYRSAIVQLGHTLLLQFL